MPKIKRRKTIVKRAPRGVAITRGKRVIAAKVRTKKYK